VRLRSVLRRLRSESGFGLIELVIALALLSVGLFTLLAAYSSGSAALVRAARAGTGGVLADKQMELYRSIQYDNIRLDPASIPTDPAGSYLSDSAYASTQVITPACSSATYVECNASRAVTGPDDHNYQVDVYIAPLTTSGDGTKRVTVVVRDNADGANSRVVARQVSIFDRITGCSGSSC
jgi:prepilin-type N-terminal cleavage/methylation domain-containing protein